VRDAVAGTVVGVVALPLAIAFAIASGVKPEQGLYTAIVGGFLISALGGSRVQIGGPTGAFIVIVYGIVQQYGYEGLAVATVIAGLLLIVMGLAGLGSVIKFVPYPVTVGFTSGIALIIALSQVRDFFGLTMPSVPPGFIDKIAAYTAYIGTWNPWAAALALLTVITLVYWPRLTHVVPGSLVAIVITTAAVQIFALPVETIAMRFGDVPQSLPHPAIPVVAWADVQRLFQPALTIALLAAIESLLSAVVADGMVGTRHRSNTELIAQGIANVVSPLFGGIPATGAIARTATNIKNGGRTPIAGMVHAVVLLLIVLFLAPLAGRIPICTLAGILVVVAYNMSEWRVFAHLFRSPRSDITVLLATFLLTVLVDLTVALETGIVLAALLFMRRMAEISKVGYVTRLGVDNGDGPAHADAGLHVPDGVKVFEIYGAFFFGAASKFKDAIAEVAAPPKVLVLRLRDVPAIDATALRALQDVFDKTKREGTKLVLAGVRDQPHDVLERAGLLERIGADNVFRDVNQAIARASALVDSHAPTQSLEITTGHCTA
jgi:SulP family sulfate permease